MCVCVFAYASQHLDLPSAGSAQSLYCSGVQNAASPMWRHKEIFNVSCLQKKSGQNELHLHLVI